MTTNGSGEPRRPAETVDAVSDGELLVTDAPTATVRVMPLWARPAAGRPLTKSLVGVAG
jgi:hypothetical protein